MRTYEEIVARVKEIQEKDFFGFKTNDLINYLPEEYARQFIDPDADLTNYKPLPTDKESVIAQIKGYMPFAWDKANNCRGLSAMRSLEHMSVWLWMLGDDAPEIELSGYTHYGKPQLRAICEHFGWDWKEWDDGHWRNNELGPSVGPEDVP